MKNFKFLHLLFIPFLLTTKCQFINFYPDRDDQGLSSLTSRGYNVASTYINGSPFVSEDQFYPLLRKDVAGGQVDTLLFTWTMFPNTGVNHTADSNKISFLIPVTKSFTKTNLLAFNGQRFSNAIPLSLQDSSMKINTGISSLYFVSVSEVSISDQKFIKLSGLFNGNIGDSILVTKGRFDFKIDENTLNF